MVARASASIEERVAEVEKQLFTLQMNLGILDQKVKQQKLELQADLEKEAAARRTGDEGVHKKLEEGMIGDSPLEVAGVSYLFIGLFMTNLSAEVAKLLVWLGLS